MVQKHSYAIALIFLLLTVTSSSIAAPFQQSPLKFRLFFTAIPFAKGERMGQFKLSLACGHFQAINTIPEDWNINVVRAVSAVEEIDAEAGHGASWLPDLHDFDGTIVIIVQNKSCFNVSGTMQTYGLGSDTMGGREIKLSNGQFRLFAIQ